VPSRPVRLRELAAVDIDQAIDDYLAEADTEVALRFVDAIGRILHTRRDISSAIGDEIGT
jgi:plasmid stabilization system protein ParE